MDSFIFNNFKKRFLKGEVPPEDNWKFTFVNSKFDKYQNVNAFKDQNDFITVSGTDAFENACTEVKPVHICYSALQTVDVNYSSMKPMFINTKNWEEFEKQYHVYIVNTDANGVETPRLYYGQDLYTLFFSLDAEGNKNGLFGMFDGFYWVRTKEELAWCADHVNGEINGNRIGSFNNKIAIVLGDDIGIDDLNPNYSYTPCVKIDSCIGKYPDRMFEGLFFGNGFGIKNINLICNNDTNGIIGYLGQGGMIRNVTISGKNYVTCENKITINHIKNKATDVVAGILCGCNYGSIVDVMAVGSVQFNKFVPGVYCVRNKTDGEGTDTFPDSNKFFPSYFCINSPGNIIPYVGYFNEGVFGSNTYKTKVEHTPGSYSANVLCPSCNGKKITGVCSNCHGRGYMTIKSGEKWTTIKCTGCDGSGLSDSVTNCSTCNGTGYTSQPSKEEPDKPLVKCTTCNGSGKNYICLVCEGAGYSIDDNNNVISCTACTGTGVIESCRCTTCEGHGYHLEKIKEESVTATLYKQWCSIDSSNNVDNSDAAMISYSNWSDSNFKLSDEINSNTFGYVTYYDYKVINETEKLVDIDPGTDVTNGLVWEVTATDGSGGKWVQAQGDGANLPAVDTDLNANNGISDKNGSRQNISELINTITAEKAEYFDDADYFRTAYKAAGDITLGIAYTLAAVNPNEMSNANSKINEYGGHGLGLQKYVNGKDDIRLSNRHSYMTAVQFLDKAIKMNQAARCAYYVSPVVGMNKSDLFNTYVEENISHSGTFVGFLGGAVGKQCGGVLDNVTVNLNAYNYLKRDVFATSADNSIENKEAVVTSNSQVNCPYVKTINCKTEFDRTPMRDANGNIINHRVITVTKDESGSTTKYTGVETGKVHAQYPSFTFDSGRSSEPIAFPTYDGLNINLHEFKNARMYVVESYYSDLNTMQTYSAEGLFTIPLDRNNLIRDNMHTAVTGSHNLNQHVNMINYAAYDYGEFEMNSYSAIDSSELKQSNFTSGSLNIIGSPTSILNKDDSMAYDDSTQDWLVKHWTTMGDYGYFVDIIKYESLFDILSYVQKPEWTVYDDNGKRYFKTTTQAWFTPYTLLEAIRCSFVQEPTTLNTVQDVYINADPTVTEVITCESIVDDTGAALSKKVVYPQKNAEGVSYVDYALGDNIHRIRHRLDAVGNFSYPVKDWPIHEATRWGKQFISPQPLMLNTKFTNEVGETLIYPVQINAIAINEIVCHEEDVQEGNTLSTVYKQSKMVIDKCIGITFQGISCDAATNKRTEIEIYIDELDMTDPNSLNFIDKMSSRVLNEFKRDADKSEVYTKANVTGESSLIFYDKRRRSTLNINDYNRGIYKYINLLSDATLFNNNNADQVLYYKYFFITNDMIKNYQSTLKSITNIGALAGSLVVNNKQYICNCNGFLNNYQGTIFERESFKCIPSICGNTKTYTGLYLMNKTSTPFGLSTDAKYLEKGYVTHNYDGLFEGEVFDKNSVPMLSIRYLRGGYNNYADNLTFKGPTKSAAYEVSRVYTDSPGSEQMIGAYKYCRSLIVNVYLKTSTGIAEYSIPIAYSSAATTTGPFNDIYQLLLKDVEGSDKVKEYYCTAKTLFNPIVSTAASSYNDFKDVNGKTVTPVKDTDGFYHVYDLFGNIMPDETVLPFKTSITDSYNYVVNTNQSYAYVVPIDTKHDATYFNVPLIAIDFDENGYIYTTGNLLKMAGYLVSCKNGDGYKDVTKIFDVNGNEIDMDAHLPIFTNIGDNPIHVQNIGGTFLIRTSELVEDADLKNSSKEVIDGHPYYNKLALCRIKSLDLPANTGTADADKETRRKAWEKILKKLHYSDFSYSDEDWKDESKLFFADEAEFTDFINKGILEETTTKIEGTTFKCTYKYFTEFEKIKDAANMGWSYYPASEVQELVTENPNILSPKYADYNLLNRYGALAAICEYHSSNIRDIVHSSNDPNNVITQIQNRPVVFTNNKFAYREHSGVKGKKHYTMGPMMASKYIARASTQRAIGHKLYGIASPLIAELKVVPKSVPSVINFTNGSIPGINNEGHWRDGETNQYVGMFTLDQGFRGSVRDPGGRCMNLALDAPCIGNLSYEYHADNIFYAFDHRLIAENLFDWSSTFIDPGNNGVYDIGGGNFHPGFGYSYTTSPLQTITVATNGFKDMLPPSQWPESIQIYEDLNESKYINGAIDFDKFQAGCDMLKTTYPLYLSDDEYAKLYMGNKRRNRYAYYGSSLVLVRDDDSNFFGMANYNHIRDGKFINDCVYSYDHGTAGYQFFNLPPEGKWGLTKGWAVSLAVLPDATRYDNQFVYTYELYTNNRPMTSFNKSVKFDTLNGSYGYWIQNSIANGAESDYPVSALSAANTAYSEYYTLPGEEVNKYEPVDEGNLHYRGNLLTLGITKSPKQIRQEISLYVHSWTSAISGTDIQGLLVQDSNDNNVMYINMNMGDCYGTETWNMNCKASDDTATSGVSGLLLEVGV